MPKKYFTSLFVLFLYTNVIAQTHHIPASARICGKWESVGKTLIVQVYLEHNEYMAKLLWYSDTEGKPLDYWRDVNNPNPKLRGRRLLGMSILSGLRYNRHSNSWENGIIYDSRHGRYWNASARINKKGRLKVRGYWHFKFIGRTLTFIRISR